MTQTIHRMFDSHERASQAALELRNHGSEPFDDVHVFGNRGPTGAELSTDEIVAAIMKGQVAKANAKVLAPAIKRGGTLVTVHAPFGTAVSAITQLEQHGPIESGLPDFKQQAQAWDEAAPLSSLLHWPALLPDSATFSRFWNLRPLVKSGATTFSALGMPEISRSAGQFSGTFPLPLLSSKPAPLSTLLGLPLLTQPHAAKR